jgi:diguanylate cyclase (GGDEF)-like protein/PAS domain S-box-containing protein
MTAQHKDIESVKHSLFAGEARMPHVSSSVKNAIDKHWHWSEIDNESGHQLKLADIAFEHTKDGVIVMNENACILRVNKSFTTMSGFSAQELLGLTPTALQVSDNDAWLSLLLSGKWTGEALSYRKNGEAYQERITFSAVKNAHNEVIYYVGVFTDITEVKHSQLRLHELVNHDPLTSLPNRRLFNELLEHAIRRAERESHQIALLFIDLDRFKAINDSLGHQVGDKLLYEVSRRIKHSVRDSDVVARLGGDEFLVMMDMIKQPQDATIIAEKIIYALQVEFVIDDREIFIGASIGISIFPQDGSDVDSLIKASDIAMYQVKNRGKNNLCFYSEELSKNALERFTLESELRHALARKQFTVHYQPQISLLTGEIIGAEALLRWNHPILGSVSPAQFIPIAEETGLIVQIGEWVLRQAANQAIAWINSGYTMQWISVNVSGIQIMKSNFYDTVYGILIETDCNPNILELEITESTVMQNTEFVIDTFNKIKQLGVRVAIDDFGTGYSSLSNLKRLPLSKIKIDQSFVRGLPSDLNDAAITNTINAMARNLGFSVIAEGVETIEQADFLKNMGCEEAQGYLYGKPISTIEFTQLLTAKTKHYQLKGDDNAS